MSRGRIVIGILGLDQHETGALAAAAILRDAGMEVIYLGRFATPSTIAAVAIDEGADVAGISCHSWEYLHSIDELLERLDGPDGSIPLVVGGSVVTAADARRLLSGGVAAVFGAGTRPEEIVGSVADLVARRRAFESGDDGRPGAPGGAVRAARVAEGRSAGVRSAIEPRDSEPVAAPRAARALRNPTDGGTRT